MPFPRPRRIARAYLMSIGFWCGMALLMTLQGRSFDRHHLWSWLLDLIMQVGARAFALALWTPPIFYLVSKYLPLSKYRVRYVLCWSLGAPIFVVLHTGLFWLPIPPYNEVLHNFGTRSLQSWLEMVRTGFADEVFVYIAIVVAAHAYEYLRRLRREEAERYEYQQALIASELHALKMQLHPHFLFNTLHGIATLIDDDASKAKAMIIKLSSLLRTALDRDGSDLVRLEAELKFAREYLDLEKMRLGERLQVEWWIAPETNSLLVPQMILQPLIENAVRHGIAASREGGCVKVVTSSNDGALNIQVRNSNHAIVRSSNGAGVGLRNVKGRLKYLYGDGASLRLVAGDDRSITATLHLPALKSQPAAVAANQLARLEEDAYARSHRG